MNLRFRESFKKKKNPSSIVEQFKKKKKKGQKIKFNKIQFLVFKISSPIKKKTETFPHLYYVFNKSILVCKNIKCFMYIIYIHSNWLIHTHAHTHIHMCRNKTSGKFPLLKYTIKVFKFGFITKIVNLVLYQRTVKWMLHYNLPSPQNSVKGNPLHM